VLHSRPYHPQSRGKNERFHRTLNKEVLSLTCFRGLNEAQRAFDAWLPIYNDERPHEALGMAVPADRYRPSPRPMPARLMEPAYNEGDIVRKVGTTKAYVQFKGRAWPVGQAFFGEPGRHPAAWSGWAIWDFLWRAPDRRHRPGNEVRWRAMSPNRCRSCSRTEH
jgi:putative transposase